MGLLTVDKVFRANDGDLNTCSCSVRDALFLNPWALFFEAPSLGFPTVV